MPTISGDPEQLSALKSHFDQEAATIQQLVANLRTQLEGTDWQGPSADRFRTVWHGEFEPVLRRLEQALLDAGMEVGAARDRLIQAGA